MKKSRLFDILIGLIFTGLLGMFVYDRYVVRPKSKAVVNPTIIKANDILRRKTLISDALINTTATSSACTLFLKTSAEQSMNDYANEFIDHHVDGIVKTCAGAFPTLLQKRIDRALVACKDSVRENITKECYLALIEAKTSSVAAIIKPDVPAIELAPSLLIHLIADKFTTGEFLENPEKSLELIDALLEMEPHYLGGFKAKLMLLSMSALNRDEHYKDIFQEALADALRLSTKDPEIRELAIAEKGDVFRKNPDVNAEPSKINPDFIDYLDEQTAKNPTEWIYDYYKANAIYRSGKGNFEATVALIEGALKKAPMDPRLKQTLENLKSDDEEKRAHPFIISIGFSLDDL